MIINRSSLKDQAFSGVRWTTIEMFCSTALELIKIAILARLLSPKAYGLMAIIMIVIGFAYIFSNTGLSSAIIQRKDPTNQELSTLYWINILAGLIIYGMLCMATPFIAKGFGSQEINSLLPVASLAFVISTFGIQFRTLLQKVLRFDVLAKITVTATFLDLLVAVSFACKGYGVWSLVWGNISKVLCSTLLLISCGLKEKWRPSFHFKLSDTDGYLSFGLFRSGAMMANYFSSRLDQLAIGGLMGMEALGYYNIAVRLVLQPIQRLNPVLRNVAFPVFSRVQDDTDRLKKGFLKLNRILTTINAPILIGLAAVAPLAVPFLVGEKWIPSVPLVQILAFYALIRSIGNAGGSLILAKGKANWSFYWNVAIIFFILPVIYLASLGGDIIHIAYALVGVEVILFFLNYILRIRKLIGLCLSEYLQAMQRPVFLSIIMSAVVLTCSFIIFLPSSLKLFVMISIGILTYLVLSWFFQRDMYVEFIELLPARFGLAKFKQFL